MNEADLRLSKKQAVAKAWLQKIENQGIMEFGSSDYLSCARSLDFGLGDFTCHFLVWMDSYSQSTGIRLLNSTTSGDRVSLSLNASGQFNLFFLGIGTFALDLNLVDGEPYILSASIDRDGEAFCVANQLSEPGNTFVSLLSDISSAAGINISGTTGAEIMDVGEGLIWPLPLVNRAMTADEINTLVEGVMSPNSWPDDLRGVGRFISLASAINDSTSPFTTFTGASATGFTAELATGAGYCGWACSLFAGERVQISFDIDVTSGSPSANLKPDSLISATSIALIRNNMTSGHYTFNQVIDGDVDYITFSEGDSPSSFTVSNFRLTVLGQIFDIRPTRSGTHTDGTGNGYDWTDSGSPTIKPFSAGIQ